MPCRGGRLENPDEALVVLARAGAPGCSTTVGIVHDRQGGMLKLAEPPRAALGPTPTAIRHPASSAIDPEAAVSR